ncbi:MAG: SDR family oxidoreductase [Alphaproteobacteria bacterium]|nr:SDR family oxidoreductase [Alphaproteobacteria bacterium]
MGKLDGKVAIVTGGTGALGRAFSRALAGEGAKIVATGRNEDRGKETVRLVREAGGGAIFVQHDVTQADDWARVMDETLDHYGRLDTLVNNAGDAVLKPIDDLTPEDLQYLMRLNFEGPFLGMKMAIPRMIDGGAIINITVLTAIVGNANSTAYSAAKGSLAHLTRALAKDCARVGNNIRVNAIVPGVLFEGGVVSPGATRVHGGPDGARRFQAMIAAKTPLGRIGEPEDAAAAAVYLASDEARHVTGMEFVVDGGRIAGGN